MDYRRAKTPGATYFFTVVTYNRQPILTQPEAIAQLRQVFHVVKAESPFTIDAIVILPDHIHSIWTLPDGDADFSSRWRRIKAKFSQQCPAIGDQIVSSSRRRKGERGIWQRRFWEHQIRDDTDFCQHVDYIHYNPVKHRLVVRPQDWPYSSFHRYVNQSVYSVDWGATKLVNFPEEIGHE